MRNIVHAGLGPGRAAVIISLLESDSTDAPCYDPVLRLNSLLVIWLDGRLFILKVLLILLVHAYAWWGLCSSFGSSSVTLCNGLAAVACHLAMCWWCRFCWTDGFRCMLTCSFGQNARCLTYWSWWCSSEDKCKSHSSCDWQWYSVVSWSPALLTCAGHDAGSEAAIHAMRAMFWG